MGCRRKATTRRWQAARELAWATNRLLVCDAPLWAMPLQILRLRRAEFQECYAVFVQARSFARNRPDALLSATEGFGA
jgi:hypothetical protein